MASKINLTIKKYNAHIDFLQKKFSLKKDLDLKLKENSENAESHQIDELTKKYQELLEIEKHDNYKNKVSIELEECKLFLLKQIYKKIREKKVEEKDNKTLNIAKTLLFISLFLVGLPISFFGGALNIATILSILPHFSYILNLGLQGLFGLVSVSSYLSLESSNIKDKLGIKLPWDKPNLYDVVNKQIEITNKLINEKHINSNLAISDNFLKSAHADFRNKKEDKDKKFGLVFEEPQVTNIQKIKFCSVIGLNLALTAGSSFFFAKALLSFCLGAAAATILSSPIGMIVCAAVIFSGIACLIAVRSDGLFNMMEPNFKKQSDLFKNLKHHEEKYHQFKSHKHRNIIYSFMTKIKNTQEFLRSNIGVDEIQNDVEQIKKLQKHHEKKINAASINEKDSTQMDNKKDNSKKDDNKLIVRESNEVISLAETAFKDYSIFNSNKKLRAHYCPHLSELDHKKEASAASGFDVH